MPLSGESALRIDANAAIAGQPIKRIRELLRRMGNAHWSHLQIAEFFQIDPTQAIALIGEMWRADVLMIASGDPVKSPDSTTADPRGHDSPLPACFPFDAAARGCA